MPDADWTSLLRMYWNTNWLRSEADAQAAADELRHEFSGRPPDNDELCDVIRWLKSPEANQEKPPSLKELIRAICICRRKNRQENYGYLESDQGRDARIGRTKAAMLKARSHNERWDLLCDAIKMPDEGDEIMTWASKLWPDWQYATDRIKANMVKGVAEIIGQTAKLAQDGDDGLDEWYQK